MKFKLISTGNGSFSVVLADVRSAKQLNITELELEDPALISRESVISEIPIAARWREPYLPVRGFVVGV